MLTASMLFDPAVPARRSCVHLGPGRDSALLGSTPRGERWEWCWDNLPRVFNLLFAIINMASTKVHIVTTAALIGYWK